MHNLLLQRKIKDARHIRKNIDGDDSTLVQVSSRRESHETTVKQAGGARGADYHGRRQQKSQTRSVLDQLHRVQHNHINHLNLLVVLDNGCCQPANHNMQQEVGETDKITKMKVSLFVTFIRLSLSVGWFDVHQTIAFCHWKDVNLFLSSVHQ